MSKEKRLQNLRSEYATCDRCPLHATRKKYLYGHGNPDAKMVFVLDKVSEMDVKTGRLLKHSMHGEVLIGALSTLELTMEDVWVTPALLCGEEEPGTPKVGQVKACRDRLHQEIHTIQPNVIVCLGSWAVKAVVAKKPPNVTSAAGRAVGAYIMGDLIPYQLPAVITYSPGFLLRNQDVAFGGPWHTFFKHIGKAALISDTLEELKCGKR